jgi:hypothetical protein
MNILNTKVLGAIGVIAICGLSILPASADGCFAFNHPRRAEVLGRDAALNHELCRDRGSLSGQYGRLRNEDRAIARQEQRDAWRNGGYITRGEQRRLNHEENRVQRQINHDHF